MSTTAVDQKQVQTQVKDLNVTFGRLQGTVDRLFNSTPIDEIAAAKQRLVDLNKKIADFVEANKTKTMLVKVAQITVPLLITKCDKLLMDKSKLGVSSTIGKRDLSSIAAAVKAQASGGGAVPSMPTPVAKREETTEASQASTASKAQAVAPTRLPVPFRLPPIAALPAVAAPAEKKEETAIPSFEKNTAAGTRRLPSRYAGKVKEEKEESVMKTRFETLKGHNAAMADLSNLNIRESTYGTLVRNLSAVAVAQKANATISGAKATKRPDLFTVFSEATPAPAQSSVDLSKPPARTPPTRARAATASSASSSVAVESVKPEPIFTEILINCKVPIGHSLFIRGDKEGGLDWENGAPLVKKQGANNVYQYRFEESTDAKSFQFILSLDDEDNQCEKERRTMEVGKSQEFTPALALPYVPFLVHYKATGSDKLFIRGTGPGLNWDKGVELNQIDEGKWTFELPSSCDPFEFKILVNDEHWEPGENHVTQAGKTMGFTYRI